MCGVSPEDFSVRRAGASDERREEGGKIDKQARSESERAKANVREGKAKQESEKKRQH